MQLQGISLIGRVPSPFAKHNKPNAPREFFRVILDNSRRVRPRKKSPDYDIFARALTIGRRNLKNVESLTIRPASASYWMPAGELNKQLQDGVEASLELFVKLSGGHPIRSRRRSYRQRLYVFKISATDRERTGKDVVIWTFLSGPHAPTIIENYTKKFSRGVRFIVFGKWRWDAPDQTYTLQLHKPDEIEVLPPVSELPVVVRGQE